MRILLLVCVAVLLVCACPPEPTIPEITYEITYFARTTYAGTQYSSLIRYMENETLFEIDSLLSYPDGWTYEFEAEPGDSLYLGLITFDPYSIYLEILVDSIRVTSILELYDYMAECSYVLP